MKIEDSNKLIAEFMGLGYDIEGRVSFMYSIGEEFPLSQRFCEESLIEDEVQKEIEEANPYDFMVETYSFHTSWDWLMQVIQKIESLGYDVNISGITCSINRLLEKDKPIVRFVCGNKEDKIGLVYLTIVHFINWYNENKIS